MCIASKSRVFRVSGLGGLGFRAYFGFIGISLGLRAYIRVLGLGFIRFIGLVGFTSLLGFGVHNLRGLGFSCL